MKRASPSPLPGISPNGSDVMFMKATTSQLIEGASNAASIMELDALEEQEAVNIAISCVGRKLVMGQKIDDEIEAVLNNLPENIKTGGFTIRTGRSPPLITESVTSITRP